MGLAHRLREQISKLVEEGDVRSPQNIEVAVNIPGDQAGRAVASAHQHAPIVQDDRREERVDRPR
jgi:hypothetical protein